MEKLRFEFMVTPGSDDKTNILAVTSITTCDEKTYVIPEILQAASHHKEGIKTSVYNKVKKKLTKRYQTRRVWITLTEELKKTYIDEDGNFQFGDQFLEEIYQDKATTASNQKFIWSEECQKSFDTAKNLLCSQPVLEIFDQELPINIYTDASLKGVGSILKQIQPDGREKPIAYFSKKLNEAQKKKKAIYLECLAIKEAVKYWQYWLIEKSFTVYTDHKPLENMNLKSRTDEELGDLTYYLSQYEFKIKYRPGRQNLGADCLSRNPVLETNENTDEQLRVVNFMQMDDILKDQFKNEEIK